MTLSILYLILSISLLNLVDKPIDIDSTKDQIYVIISDASCHECIMHVEEWTSKSEMEMTAVIWYSKGIIEKKGQIKFYNEFISPNTWAFSKDLVNLSEEFNLKHSPNIIVVKGGKTHYFKYVDLFTGKSRVDEFKLLIGYKD
jgi:hypothetical protein